jgi:hypothetical protein
LILPFLINLVSRTVEEIKESISETIDYVLVKREELLRIIEENKLDIKKLECSFCSTNLSNENISSVRAVIQVSVPEKKLLVICKNTECLIKARNELLKS